MVSGCQEWQKTLCLFISTTFSFLFVLLVFELSLPQEECHSIETGLFNPFIPGMALSFLTSLHREDFQLGHVFDVHSYLCVGKLDEVVDCLLSIHQQINP